MQTTTISVETLVVSLFLGIIALLIAFAPYIMVTKHYWKQARDSQNGDAAFLTFEYLFAAMFVQFVTAAFGVVLIQMLGVLFIYLISVEDAFRAFWLVDMSTSNLIEYQWVVALIKFGRGSFELINAFLPLALIILGFKLGVEAALKVRLGQKDFDLISFFGDLLQSLYAPAIIVIAYFGWSMSMGWVLHHPDGAPHQIMQEWWRVAAFGGGTTSVPPTLQNLPYYQIQQ